MPQVIDLTFSPGPEIIDISSDHSNTSPGPRSRKQTNKKRKKKNGKTSNDLASASISNSSAQPSRAHSPEIANKHSELDEPTPPRRSTSVSLPQRIPSSAADEPGLFIFDGAGAPVVAEDPSPSPEPTESNLSNNKLLLPSHVAIFRDDGPVPAEVLLAPPNLGSDDEDYIEYLDYEDRKAPGLVRYFEVEGGESSQSRPSIFKCKNCGAEGDHKTYECPVQICLTCGAHNEHSTRSCPISKTCYTCGMKGHINKTCPNRFSAHVSSDLRGDCGRCGSAEHKLNECPTLWRIYQYVKDEERDVITQCREEKKRLAIGEGGEGYVGGEAWCYNCANTGHLGDDCDELPHPATSPTGYSAFGSHNVMSGPFYDPAAEPVSIKRGPRERPGDIDWDANVPVDVGKQGKNKDKERLEKRFREQEDEGGDWFSEIRNTKRKGMDQQAPPSGPHGKTLKFGLLKDGGHELSSSLATRPSLLARLGDSRGGRSRGKGDRGLDRQEPSHQFENSIRIRGAATDQRQQDGKYSNSRKTERESGQERWDGGQPRHRGPERGQGPRYRGGYSR